TGDWNIKYNITSCKVKLEKELLKKIGGYKINIQSDCFRDIFYESPVAWRPAPDGIALLNSVGDMIIFLSRDGESYRSNVWSDKGLLLTKIKQ
ncbi:AprI/Inh family metalloprotease inhibitor, partial [Salmonella enterica]|nr:AprI/Inh family metalloprotease inhibitor [Salmonella enterica]